LPELGEVVDKLAVAFATAQRAIERLERARIVKRVGDAKRDRVYCATALREILEEPARLKPALNKQLGPLSNRGRSQEAKARGSARGKRCPWNWSAPV
jgi:hypothetical protein